MRIFILVMFILALGCLGCADYYLNNKEKLFKKGDIVCHKTDLNKKMVVFRAGRCFYGDYAVTYLYNGHTRYESLYEYELTKCD